MADERKWKNLQNLKNLLSAGFITQEEFNERRAQLVDELTGTTTTVSKTKSKSSRVEYEVPEVVPRGPPDFSQIEEEAAMKWIYDLNQKKWHSFEVKLKLDPTPFARGALRLVFHMQDLSATDHSATYVAKISMDARDNAFKEVYFRDVEMQCVAKEYADKFNEYNPPKRVDFVKAWIYQLLDRDGQPICGVERFIDGPYRKHNNNYGYVSEEERSTPQAFSHFTYEASGHKLLVCDIQGVGDLYTDPQIHSDDGKGYGKGNMGHFGIDKFLLAHRCNAVCRYLKLPSINANFQNLGTLPAIPYMQQERIQIVRVASPIDENVEGPRVPLLPPKTKKQSSSSCCPCL